jgi:DNA-binding transcriptional LysR family regulator
MIRNFHPSILRLLRVFHAVAEHGGFTAAETVLNVGQSTISSHIKDLENRLGFEICERGRTGFRLTPAGQRLYESTQRLERDLAGFVSAVNEISDELQGVVRIGMTYILSASPLLTPVPAMLAALKQHFPAVQVEIHLDNPREIEQGATEGRYDLAISGMHLNAKNVRVTRLFGMRMYLYCGKGHPLFDMRAELIDDAVLGQFDAVVNVYDRDRQRPFHARPCLPAEASEVSIFFVLSGTYVGYLSEFLANRWVASGDLRAVRPDTYFYDAPAGLILAERAASNPAVKKVAELLVQLSS